VPVADDCTCVSAQTHAGRQAVAWCGQITGVTTDPLRILCLRHGVFLRREALGLGYTDAALRRSVRLGVLVRVRQGAYTFSDLWPADREQQHLVSIRAVLRVLEERVAVTHESSAALHGFEAWRLPLDRVHVTRLDGGSGRVEAGVEHHTGLVLPDEIVTVQGIDTVHPARAALETASQLDVERGLVIADSGLRQQLFTPDAMQHQLRLMERWPRSLHLQLVARLADGRSGSVGESRARYLLWAAGIPAPELQYEVYDGRTLVGIVDFAWPEHRLLGEFDGKTKYTRLLREGEQPGDIAFREKQREDRLRDVTGWKMVRLTWPMLERPGETAAYVRSKLRQAA
jgi:hypothetical protein